MYMPPSFSLRSSEFRIFRVVNLVEQIYVLVQLCFNVDDNGDFNSQFRKFSCKPKIESYANITVHWSNGKNDAGSKFLTSEIHGLLDSKVIGVISNLITTWSYLERHHGSAVWYRECLELGPYFQYSCYKRYGLKSWPPRVTSILHAPTVIRKYTAMVISVFYPKQNNNMSSIC
jgi:hypothetical protein